jgi:hypothetical protein
MYQPKYGFSGKKIPKNPVHSCWKIYYNHLISMEIENFLAHGTLSAFNRFR